MCILLKSVYKICVNSLYEFMKMCRNMFMGSGLSATLIARRASSPARISLAVPSLDRLL
jgi:hypothetical protein